MAKANKDGLEAAKDDATISSADVTGGDESKNESGEGEEDTDNMKETNEHPFPEEEEKLVSYAMVNFDRLKAIAQGREGELDDTGRGHSKLETGLKVALQQPNPNTIDLFHRLRALNNSFTIFKVNGLLAELPSKQLLLRYLEENDETAVAADLKTNFRFTRDHLTLARALYQLVTSDFERGLLYKEITGMQNVLEYMMRNSVRNRLAKQVDALEIILNRKLAANESLNETSVLELELDRSKKLYDRFYMESVTIQEGIYKSRKELKRIMYSVGRQKAKNHISQGSTRQTHWTSAYRRGPNCEYRDATRVDVAS